MASVTTDDSFAVDVLANPRPVIVEFWADWCGPCRQVRPVLDAIAADYEGTIALVTVNVDENPRTARTYNVLHVPTICVFRGGELVKQVIGARSKAAMLREVGELLVPSAV